MDRTRGRMARHLRVACVCRARVLFGDGVEEVEEEEDGKCLACGVGEEADPRRCLRASRIMLSKGQKRHMSTQLISETEKI